MLKNSMVVKRSKHYNYMQKNTIYIHECFICRQWRMPMWMLSWFLERPWRLMTNLISEHKVQPCESLTSFLWWLNTDLLPLPTKRIHSIAKCPDLSSFVPSSMAKSTVKNYSMIFLLVISLEKNVSFGRTKSSLFVVFYMYILLLLFCLLPSCAV